MAWAKEPARPSRPEIGRGHVEARERRAAEVRADALEHEERGPDAPVLVFRIARLLLGVLGLRVTEQQPSYAKNEYRSIRPAFLVLQGVCTHLGCAPLARFEVAPADLGPSWPGGFFCPCHGSKFDLAGRVFNGVPAPANLLVPPYRFINDNTILIGSDTGST